MAIGTIKAVKLDKGFGFIARRDGLPDVFMHCRDIAPDGGLLWDEALLERDVQFSVAETSKGLRAVDIRPARV